MPIIKKYVAVLILVVLLCVSAFAEDVSEWMPDAALQQAVREALELPADAPLTKEQMVSLKHLNGNHRGIVDLTGLEFATNLRQLFIGGNNNHIADLRPLTNLTNLVSLHIWHTDGYKGPVTNLDISPLANLINLEFLSLEGNGITDISPLSGLKNLRALHLTHNHIEDFSPLSGLVNLRKLWIINNWGTDFSPLAALNLTDFRYDMVCDPTPLGAPVIERIKNRSFPSVFQPWESLTVLGESGTSGHIWHDPLVYDQRLAMHDLFFDGNILGLEWDITATEPTKGLATRLAGEFEVTKERRQRQLDINPNLLFLHIINHYSPLSFSDFPPDSDFWVRDANGEIVVFDHPRGWKEYQIDFLKPHVQDRIVEKIVGIANCGLYNGVMFDGLNNNTGFAGRETRPEITDEEIIAALTRIFREARARVPDDFLILVNANKSKLTAYAEYLNGTFMELDPDYPYGYTYKGLAEIESTLLWSEQNLRAPQINCLEGAGMRIESPDSPTNQRWMRVFTTMSLTHSDGYIVYTTGASKFGGTGSDHGHIWYSFWDADLGKSLGEKGQLCDNCEGLFIREFTNGWAVYNRSGQAQTIKLPMQATGVASSIIGTQHTVPDLDGEIYLKQETSTNESGAVIVLDTPTGDPQEDPSEWMPDAALRAAVREQLELATHIPLTKDKMLWLTRLQANDKGIVDITGLEHATNLKILHLGGRNRITDLRPVANLINLVQLHVWHTPTNETDPVTDLDISPIAGLINLEVLSLENNGISDIRPLAGLKKLQFLALTHNQIEDFSPLAGLTNLRTLWIKNNPGTDFSPLASLNLTDFQHDADVNNDGVVNIQDLVIVANAFGKAEPDINGDGVVNIQDLVIVANAFGQ